MLAHELIELLNEFPRDAKITIMYSGYEDDGERISNDPHQVDAEPQDIEYYSRDNEIFFGRW